MPSRQLNYGRLSIGERSDNFAGDLIRHREREGGAELRTSR